MGALRQTEQVGLEHFTQSFQDSLDLTDTADKIQVTTTGLDGCDGVGSR